MTTAEDASGGGPEIVEGSRQTPAPSVSAAHRSRPILPHKEDAEPTTSNEFRYTSRLVMNFAPSVLVSLLIISGTLSVVNSAVTKAVTHEEIKDALINFMHIVRSNTEKLERHESRERQLGELLKRALAALDKRERAQDAILEKLLEKIEKIENAITESGDAARGTYTVDTIPGQSMMTQIETMIDKTTNNDKLREMESSINSKIDYLSSVVEKLQASVYDVNARMGSLSEKSDKDTQAQVDLNRDLAQNLEKQIDSLKSIQDDVASGDLGDVKKDLVTELNGVAAKLEHKLSELTSSVTSHERTLADSVRDSKDLIEGQLTELKMKFEDLNKEAKAIGNVEQVLVKTADDVMDTKRRVEHGIYQIRAEINDYVKPPQNNGGEYNDTVITKFTGMAETILENQAGTVANLSTKVESEISQVWRQIGIMHQQITASGIVLDNLQNQTNSFVKDTENKMDAMSSKLEGIESSIDLVQENNNFLVGKFSLFTHEFNETRNSLALTTKDLKEVLKNYKLHATIGSPGPHDIESSSDSNIVDNKV
ncbi:hypothetical protein GE061_013578 [Apolygus lucorum]|uniref:Uncharacterized protein n=1 Tax=Apolygus lucorum TaxID=248454 RepID=A0A8S9XN38_APOLU|nr:hypothetical protein GE061_013578 [Apolygus lucorum]